MLDGNRVKPNETAKTLELQDNDQLDAMLETLGGGLLHDKVLD
jgi:hypothetical protein